MRHAERDGTVLKKTRIKSNVHSLCNVSVTQALPKQEEVHVLVERIAQ